MQDGANLVKKVKGVICFKVTKGPDGQEGVWYVDAKSGTGAVKFGGEGEYLMIIAFIHLSEYQQSTSDCPPLAIKTVVVMDFRNSKVLDLPHYSIIRHLALCAEIWFL